MAQEHLGSLRPALDHVRRRMLPALADRKRALPGELAHRDAVIGRRPALVLVEPKLWLVNAQRSVDLLERLHDPERDDGVARAVEQPYPAVGEVGWIIDQVPACSLSDEPDGLFGLWG